MKARKRMSYMFFSMCLFCMFLCTAVIRADTVYFTNGETMDDVAVKEKDAHSVAIEIAGGVMLFSKDEISRIEQGSSMFRENNQKIHAHQSTDATEKAELIEEEGYLLYIPAGIERAKRYPLVVALAPNGDAKLMIDTWKKVADTYVWLIYASRTHKNGVSWDILMPPLYDSIMTVVRHYPVRSSHIIATGFSGGGMSSYVLAYRYPQLISTVVINTAMMHAYHREHSQKFPRNKKAVMLASKTDFRYDEMQRDQTFLREMGWKTKWIEFIGGHRIAPEDVYLEAAAWLQEMIQ